MEPSSRRFEPYQNITTTGAYDWTYMKINGYHFLVVANSFTVHPTRTTRLSSTLYFWRQGHFIPFQNISVRTSTCMTCIHQLLYCITITIRIFFMSGNSDIQCIVLLAADNRCYRLRVLYHRWPLLHGCGQRIRLFTCRTELRHNISHIQAEHVL